MSVWKDIPEWTPGDGAADEGWTPLVGNVGAAPELTPPAADEGWTPLGAQAGEAPELTPDASDEGWLSLIWILRGGLWDDGAEWVDTEEWDD